MADVKVSELTAAGAFDGNELVPVVQNGVTKRAAVGSSLVTVDTDQTVAGSKKFNALTLATAAFKHRPWADPTHPDFGAVGDGDTDDTTAVQSAFDVASGGGTVRLPGGVYVVGGVFVHHGTSLTGSGFQTADGAESTVLKLADGANTSVLASANTEGGFGGDPNMHGVFIRDLVIHGNKANNTAGHGLHLVSTGFVSSVERLLITQCAQDGIRLGGPGITISDRFQLEMVGVASCAGAGVHLAGDTGYTAIHLSSLKVDNCAYGLRAVGGSGRRWSTIVVTNYRSEVHNTADTSLMADSIWLEGVNGAYVIVQGAHFLRATSAPGTRSGAGIRVTGTSARLQLSGVDQNVADAYTNLVQDDVNFASKADGPLLFWTSGPDGDGAVRLHRDVIVESQSAADRGLRFFRAGESDPRFQIKESELSFGSGAGAASHTLARVGANMTATGTWQFGGLLFADGTFRHRGSQLGFFNAAATSKPEVTGSADGNAALQSLLTALETLGLITDSTT